MEMKPVTSSQISEIGYDPETRTLAVKFKKGGLYHYADVGPEKHQALMSAPSIGGHLHGHIKGLHKHTKIG